MKNIDVSVIITCFNDVQYLKDCIESINTQKIHLKLEIIIIDNSPSKKNSKFIKIINC